MKSKKQSELVCGRLVKRLRKTINATAFDAEVEAAMSNFDAEYEALVASTLVSA